MIARKYNKYIEIYQTTNVSDGFGGSTVTDELLYSVWANIDAKRANIVNEQGINSNITEIVFTIRYIPGNIINEKEYFIIYNGLVYNIDSILNIGLNNINIEIKASQTT